MIEFSKEAGDNLIYIIKNVLHDKPSLRYENYHDIYKLARFHNVQGISFLGIKDYKDLDIYDKWKKDYDVTMLRNLYFEVEREQILSKIKSKGLSYMTLKGVNLLSYYKDLGMRFMSDNDILYGFVENNVLLKDREKEAQDIIVEIMKEMGYEVYSLKGKDDVFHKKPFYNFEFHRRLTESGNEHFDYYLNPLEYAYQDESDSYRYRFHIEDEYIYVVEHAYKHLEYAGVGIRYLIDMYVMLEKHNNDFDFDYINKQIDILNIKDFYDKSYKLCMNAFKYEMDDKDKEFLYFLLSCGTYGTNEQQFHNRMKNKNKFTYLLNRIYTNDPAYKDQYPIFYKYAILKPILPIYRLTLALIRSPKRILQEIKLLIRK